MRIASINLNKRLGNPAARGRLADWLQGQRVDVLIGQEPWKPVDRDPLTIAGFRQVGGDGRLYTWISERWEIPSSSRPCDFAQRIELSWLVVLNVYLDAYTTTTRSSQLTELTSILAAEGGRPVVAAGDFNLAPRPADGLTDGRPSSFNNTTDRIPFQRLIDTAGLLDAAADLPPQFTVERQRSGRQIQFRCDLALISDHLASTVVATYDHTTRDGPAGFTDHSAILIDLPVSLTAITDDSGALFSVTELRGDQEPQPAVSYQPHKTAMTRNTPSPFARHVTDVLVPKLGVGTLLDHGCGRGSDVKYYRSCGLDADGYDPHPGFQWTKNPERIYELVTQVFVLNVLPDPWQRIQALRHAAQFLRPGGHLLVVTRSPIDIRTRAAASGWRAHHDGYWSSESKGTFQKGISSEEITALARFAGLEPATRQGLLIPVQAACQVLLAKPS
jgi:Methyltransferase domain/Endonuclease/Exonuclease/phosphatase family